MEGDAQPSQAMEGLLMAPIWLSLSVEGDELIEGSHTPLTDWRIVVAAPLTVENQLPVKGTAMVWERSLVSHFAYSPPQNSVLDHPVLLTVCSTWQR